MRIRSVTKENRFAEKFVGYAKHFNILVTCTRYFLCFSDPLYMFKMMLWIKQKCLLAIHPNIIQVKSFFFLFLASINSSNKLHARSVYWSKYTQSDSIVCCSRCSKTYVRSLHHLANLEAKIPCTHAGNFLTPLRGKT